MIHPILYPLDILDGEFFDVYTLGDESSDQLVLVFFGAPFPSAIWMCVVDVCSFFERGADCPIPGLTDRRNTRRIGRIKECVSDEEGI